MPLKGRQAVDKAMQQTKVNANKDIRGVYFSGLARVITQSPVDEGRVRNNWFLTVGRPFSLTSGRDENKGGSGSFTSLNELPKYVLNKKMFFTNNLPYIETLEYGGYPKTSATGKTTNGFSNQIAPSGWVRKILKEMANKIRQL